MTLNAEELEQPYFIPTSENVSQILAELRAAEAGTNRSTAQQQLAAMRATAQTLQELKAMTQQSSTATATTDGIQLNRDFILVRRRDGLITWEGTNSFGDYEADQGFATETDAIANAESELLSTQLPELSVVADIQKGRDYSLLRRPTGLTTWSGEGKFSQYESSGGFHTEAGAIANAITELYAVNLAAGQIGVIASEDFTVDELHGLYHWSSCGDVFGDEYCSEDGFATVEDCVNDAIEFLSELYQEEMEGAADFLSDLSA